MPQWNTIIFFDMTNYTYFLQIAAEIQDNKTYLQSFMDFFQVKICLNNFFRYVASKIFQERAHVEAI